MTWPRAVSTGPCCVAIPRRFAAATTTTSIDAFEDLRADRGIRVACWRAMVDLVVTVPKYRLESAMSERRARFTLAALTIMLAFACFATLAGGAWPVSFGLLTGAVVLLVGQRGAGFQSSQTQPTNSRRRLLTGFVVALTVFAALVGAYLVDIGDDHVGSRALMLYNFVGLISLFGGVMLTIALVKRQRPT